MTLYDKRASVQNGVFGFRPASKWGIKAPFDVPDESFMALELEDGSLDGITGTVVYSKEILSPIIILFFVLIDRTFNFDKREARELVFALRVKGTIVFRLG